MRDLYQRDEHAAGSAEARVQEPSAGRRETCEEDVADEVVAEAEAEAVHAEEAPFAEPLELFRQLRGVKTENRSKRLRLEWLVEDGRSDEHAMRVPTLGAALSEQSVGQRGRKRRPTARRDRFAHEAGIAARRAVQVGYPERCELSGGQRFEHDERVREGFQNLGS